MDRILKQLKQKLEERLYGIEKKVNTLKQSVDTGISRDAHLTHKRGRPMGGKPEDEKKLLNSIASYKDEIKKLQQQVTDYQDIIGYYKTKMHIHRIRILKHINRLKSRIKNKELERLTKDSNKEIIVDLQNKNNSLKLKLMGLEDKEREHLRWRLQFNEILGAKEEEIERIYSKVLELEDEKIKLLEKMGKI